MCPVLESLGFNRKQKKFTKWPVLLKDFIHNLHQEFVSKEPFGGQLSQIKQEINQVSTPSLMVKEEADSKSSPGSQTKKTAKATKDSKLAEGQDGKLTDHIFIEDEEMEDLNQKHFEKLVKAEAGSPIRNLHVSSPKIGKSSKDMQVDDVPMAVERTPGCFSIDMN